MTPALPVRIWGLAADQQPFFLRAMIRNATLRTATLSDVACSLRLGNVIGLQYENARTRCRIASILEDVIKRNHEYCIELLEDQACPWEQVVVQAIPPVNTDRRRWNRHNIGLPVELLAEQPRVCLKLKTADVSGSGCYIEMPYPLPRNSTLTLNIRFGEQRVSTTAVVKTSHGGVGMGIGFSGMNEQMQESLQQYIVEQTQRNEKPSRC
jgi:hypothetical protein